jgi:hypothetical protein
MFRIGLKTVRFSPEFKVKVQFYLTALNETAQQPGENPSIGIILCKSKKKTIVEYALKEADLYLWAGRNDKHPNYQGNEALAEKAKLKGLSVEWRSSEGGHCTDIDIPSIANFLL